MGMFFEYPEHAITQNALLFWAIRMKSANECSMLLDLTMSLDIVTCTPLTCNHTQIRKSKNMIRV